MCVGFVAETDAVAVIIRMREDLLPLLLNLYRRD